MLTLQYTSSLHAFKKLLLACLVLFAGNSFAQVTCNPVFQNFYGGEKDKDDEAIGVTYCNSGGMIVCGQTTSYSAGQYDGFLMKLTEDGTPQWTKVIGAAGNDKLIKAKQTTDGGFIALGETASFANTNGETWVVKTDAAGVVQWNKRYSLQLPKREKPKDIIVLKDGGYCIAINANDSTAGGNAVITKLDNTGTIIWSKVLDNGGDDGVNGIAEYNDTLLLAGYATGDGRDAIVTKLYKGDGAFISARRYANEAGYHDEALSVEAGKDGYNFSVMMYPFEYEASFYPFRLTHFKLNRNDIVTYMRKADARTATSYRVEAAQVRATDDNGFIYLLNDTTNYGFSTCIKVGPYGQVEWGRYFYDYAYLARTTGMDITADRGYVFAGFKSDYFITSFKNKIQVFKTDRIGQTGKCPLGLALNFVDTANYINTSFNWSSIKPIPVQVTDNQMQVGSNNFSITNTCSDKVCDTVQTLAAGCNSNYMAEYKSELNIDATDIAQLSDGGYALAGNYSYYWNLEPAVIKTNPNGSIAWAKTFNDFTHDAQFIKVLPTAGNTMLLVGSDSYTIDHGGSDSSIIMKIDYSGNVLWAKKYARGGTIFNDIQPLDDGGFVLSMNENYGLGSGQYTMVTRIDADGNFVWKQKVEARNLVLKNVFYDGTGIYVCGTAYINYSDASIRVFKLDIAKGDLIWQKILRSTHSHQSLFPISFEKIQDTLIAAVQVTTPLSDFNVKNEAGFIKLNPADGTPYRGYKITNISHVPPGFSQTFNQYNLIWATASGNDIVFANAGEANRDTSIYITSVSADGKLVWSKKYLNLKEHYITALRHSANGFLMSGTRTAFHLKDVNVYEKYPFIIKTDEQGNIANAPVSLTCINEPYAANIDTFSVEDDFPDPVTVEPLPESSFYGYLAYKAYTPYVRDIKKLWQVFCNTASNCSNIKITGTDSICNLQNIVQYKLEKNAGCTAAAIWQTDTSFVKTIAFTDSTIQLQYKKSGTTSLRASITSGCTGLSAEKVVQIAKQANSLNLGADTVLCTNNTYTLHAGAGFKTYTWSPAISADSIATISAQGMYRLTVTDFCNNTFTDDVLVSPAHFEFSAGKDTSKCNKDSVVLTATSGYMNYSWQPAYNLQKISSNKVNVFPAADTSYIVQAEKWAGCFVRDTVHITVHTSPLIDLGKDTSICTRQSLLLDAGSAFTTYRWSNGDNKPQLTVNTAGKYAVDAVTTDGCHSYDTINITDLPLPVVTLDHNTGLCFGDTRTLDGGNYVSYLWQDGSTYKTYTAAGTGQYYVQVTDQNGCIGSDTTIIATILPLAANFLPADTAICAYGSLAIQPSGNFSSYTWSTNEKTKAIRISKPGIYSLQVKDANSCIASDTITVALKQCMQGLYVPTAFTPNNDYKNDQLHALLFGNITSFDFRIYNRFGQLVFQTSDPSHGWDGKVNGMEQDFGTYVWICRYQLYNMPVSTEKGTTVLIR